MKTVDSVYRFVGGRGRTGRNGQWATSPEPVRPPQTGPKQRSVCRGGGRGIGSGSPTLGPSHMWVAM